MLIRNLIERYIQYSEEISSERHWKIDPDTIKRLITDSRMKRVWKELYTRRVRMPLDDYGLTLKADENMAIGLLRAVEGAKRHYHYNITTRSEDVEKYQTIAKAARELERSIKNSVLDTDFFEWLPSNVIEIMLRKDINPNKAAGYFCLVHDEDEFHRRGCIYQEISGIEPNGNAIKEYWRIRKHGLKS